MSETRTSAASPPRSCIPTATRRSSTARCTSRCICRSPTATSDARRPRRRVPGPRSRATRTAARATRRRPRSKRRSPRWKAASRPSASPRAWRRSARSCCALLRGGDHVVVELVRVRQHEQPAARRSPITARRDVRRRDRRRQRRARAHAGDAPRVRRDDRQSAHAGRRSRAHRRAVPRARHALRRRQHDDVAVAVPPDDRAARASSSMR